MSKKPRLNVILTYRINQLAREFYRTREISRLTVERDALAKLVAIAEAWLAEPIAHHPGLEGKYPCACNACYRRKEFRAALAAGKGEAKP